MFNNSETLSKPHMGLTPSQRPHLRLSSVDDFDRIDQCTHRRLRRGKSHETIALALARYLVKHNGGLLFGAQTHGQK